MHEIQSYEDQAIDTVLSVINRARAKLGERMTLRQLATSRYSLALPSKVSLSKLTSHLVKSSEELLRNTIEQKWQLTPTIMYFLKYLGSSTDECSNYFYFEAIFSQPTMSYPIPQATASVFFRIVNRNFIVCSDMPQISFRLEGHYLDHDIRYVTLTPDWILSIIRMKIKFFKKVETLGKF